MNLVIGINGLRRSGKDTAADYLVENHGFTKVAFAGHLKTFEEMAWKMYNSTQMDDFAKVHQIELTYRNVFGKDNSPDSLGVAKEVFDLYGHDEYRELAADGKRRRMLQVLGTEVLRNRSQDIHCRALFWEGCDKVKPGRNIVISDCRFPNEACAIMKFAKENKAKPVLIQIRRNERDHDGISSEADQKAAAHASENSAGMIPFEWIVANDLPLINLYESLAHIVGRESSLGFDQ